MFFQMIRENIKIKLVINTYVLPFPLSNGNDFVTITIGKLLGFGVSAYIIIKLP